MADLLPSTSDADGPSSGDPRVVGVDSDDADDLLAALSSRTARRLLSELHDDPASASALADRVDTSLQNAQYHLEKLESADLIEVGDTVYSEKGREMKVYVPVDRALVVVAGREEDTSGLQAALGRLLGGVGVLGLASLVVDRLAGGPTARLFTTGGGSDGAPTGGESGVDAGSGADGGAQSGAGAAGDGGTNATTTVAEEATVQATSEPTATPTPTAESTATVTDQAVEMTDSALGAADPTLLDTLATSPGMLFFLGGLTVLLVGVVVLHTRR